MSYDCNSGFPIPGDNLADWVIYSRCIILKGFPKIKLGVEYYKETIWHSAWSIGQSAKYQKNR
jgi:hypothetical protein